MEESDVNITTKILTQQIKSDTHAIVTIVISIIMILSMTILYMFNVKYEATTGHGINSVNILEITFMDMLRI